MTVAGWRPLVDDGVDVGVDDGTGLPYSARNRNSSSSIYVPIGWCSVIRHHWQRKEGEWKRWRPVCMEGWVDGWVRECKRRVGTEVAASGVW